jgi:NADH dehydrogenase
MANPIFVTGASGFVGSAVLSALAGKGYPVNALTSSRRIKSDGAVKIFKGDLLDPAVLDAGMRGCGAVIHLVGIIMEKPAAGVTFERIHHQGTVAVVDAAKRNGVRRLVHMSALGVRPNAASEYHKTKFEAEEYLRASGLDWTIFRPSMIHGPRGDFMKMEAMWARGKAPGPLFFQPFMPYFGGKKAGLLQPVYVDDVGRAMVESLEKPETVGKVYSLGGPDRITWPQLHEIVAEAVVGHRRMVAAIPVWAAKALVGVGVAPLLGFNRDQLIMSQEDNTCDLGQFEKDFGWKPRAFAPLVREYAKEL